VTYIPHNHLLSDVDFVCLAKQPPRRQRRELSLRFAFDAIIKLRRLAKQGIHPSSETVGEMTGAIFHQPDFTKKHAIAF